MPLMSDEKNKIAEHKQLVNARHLKRNYFGGV